MTTREQRSPVRWAPWKSRRGRVLMLLGGLLVMGVGVAYPLIPSSGGTIYGCYQKQAGNLRVIDPATTSCLPSEVPIWWNQAGPAGPPGPKGDPGAPGPPGTLSSLDALVGLPCQGGTREVAISYTIQGFAQIGCVAHDAVMQIDPSTGLSIRDVEVSYPQTGVVNVANLGASHLMVTDLRVVDSSQQPSDVFTVSSDCANVPPLTGCTITVTYAPLVAGSQSQGTLLWDPHGAQVISVQGTVLPASLPVTGNAKTSGGPK